MLRMTGIHNQALNDKQVNHQNPFSILSKNPLAHASETEWIKFFPPFYNLNYGSSIARHNKKLRKIFYSLPGKVFYVCPWERYDFDNVYYDLIKTCYIKFWYTYKINIELQIISQ